MEFLSHRLSNGLEVIAECNGEAYSMALGFFVQTGARDETDGLSGVSHFLEHMAFKGTASRSADDVNRELDEMGAFGNAQTDEENTVYHAALLPEFQDRVCGLLADILRPALRPADFDMEKLVILEEIHRAHDQPPFGADDLCRAAYFGTHPLSHSVLGTVESVTALPVEAMRGYLRRRYSPGNVVLAAAGRVDFAALVDAATRYCGNWEPGESGRPAAPAEPRRGFQAVHKESATQEYVLQFAPGPCDEDRDRYAAKVLATVLGDDTGSRFYWDLVDPGLAEQASLWHGEYQGAGVMMTYMVCDPESAPGNLQRIRDIMRRVEAEGVTAAELEQAKSKIRSSLVLRSERPHRRLFSVGFEWIYRRRYRSVEEESAAVAAISRDDLSALLAKYPLTQSTTLAIGPLEERDWGLGIRN